MVSVSQRNVQMYQDNVDMALGFYHSCAVSSQQGLMCWGNNPYGQLGLGTTSGTKTAGVVVSIGVVDVSTRNSHTCAVTGEQLYYWGLNADGQLGTGNQVDLSTPVAVLTGEPQTRIQRWQSSSAIDDPATLVALRTGTAILGASTPR
jgi:alpha-tubulin suppressor-like RCC1 family protein